MMVTNQNCIHKEIKSSLILQFRIICLPICCLKDYKTIIFPVVLCGCETWSVMLGEEYRLGMFENRVLKRIFKPKRG
jgi:hypothetical protein